MPHPQTKETKHSSDLGSFLIYSPDTSLKKDFPLDKRYYAVNAAGLPDWGEWKSTKFEMYCILPGWITRQLSSSSPAICVPLVYSWNNTFSFCCMQEASKLLHF